jgi:hypothetical protein
VLGRRRTKLHLLACFLSYYTQYPGQTFVIRTPPVVKNSVELLWNVVL